MIHAGILFDLFFDLDESDMFLRNVGWISTDYTVLFIKRLNSSATRMGEKYMGG
jgi:hypothetical protein